MREPTRIVNPTDEVRKQIAKQADEHGIYVHESHEWDRELCEMVDVLKVFMPDPPETPTTNDESEADSSAGVLDMQNGVSVVSVEEQLAERVTAFKNRWPNLEMSDEAALWACVADKTSSPAIRNAAMREVGL